MGIETVLVTGSTGTIGVATVRELSDAGYRVASIDQVSSEETPADDHWTGDLLDPDFVQTAVEESGADAIIHLGTIPHPLGRPGHETYESNALTTYHVLEAAHSHDVERVAIASSINAMGAVFQEEPTEVEYLPVDEEHPTTPRDPYALGKRTIELQAAGFARKVGSPDAVATLRFPWVASIEQIHEHLVESDRTLDGIESDAFATRDDLFAYLARDDAARALKRCIEADFSGHETFFTTAADTNMETPTEDLMDACYPDADHGDVSGTDSLVSCEKARRVLDWEPTVSWRDLAATERTDVAAEWRAARRQARDRQGLTRRVQ